MTDLDPYPPRAYRYWLWQITMLPVVAFSLAVIVVLIERAVRAPSIESAAQAATGTAVMLALAAFPLLSWRVRTVIDDAGITQHWITRSFHVPFTDITAVEPVAVPSRWFLRVYCGEHTFEVIPCAALPGVFALFRDDNRPPRVLVTVDNHLRHQLESAGEQRASSPPSPLKFDADRIE